MTPLSRREFVAATAAGLVSARPGAARQRPVTAAEVIERIRVNVGVPWNAKTTDGVITGDPATPVTGIAVMVMPTLDALRREAAERHNFIIVQEPTFYAPNEAPGPREKDPVYLAKKSFVDEQKLVIFRFAEHWQARRPNPAAVGLAEVLGWAASNVAGSDVLYTVPQTTLSALSAHVHDRLGVRAPRVVGRPDLAVRTVFISAGTTGMTSMLMHLPNADVVISGEPREWEAVPYVLDTWAAGRGKGMIAVGRVPSLWPGARIAAVWIRSLVSDVPVTFVSVPDPYWSPAT